MKTRNSIIMSTEELVPESVALHSTPHQRTERECPVCENKSVVKDETLGELFCTSCGTVLDKSLEDYFTDTPDNQKDSWVEFWNYRSEEYSGFAGPKRVKMVGGFARPYDFEDDF